MSTTSARSERASEARFRSRHAARAATPCVLGEMRTSSIRTECCDVVDARRDDEREIRLRGERLDETDRVGADSALAFRFAASTEPGADDRRPPQDVTAARFVDAAADRRPCDLRGS